MKKNVEPRLFHIRNLLRDSMMFCLSKPGSSLVFFIYHLDSSLILISISFFSPCLTLILPGPVQAKNLIPFLLKSTLQ